jgi:hypothetical protein
VVEAATLGVLDVTDEAPPCVPDCAADVWLPGEEQAVARATAPSAAMIRVVLIQLTSQEYVSYPRAGIAPHLTQHRDESDGT